MKISGIYKIINKINGKYYVGSSNNIHKRWLSHIESLRKGIHHCHYLQRSWNKYGEDKFDFIIIEKDIIEKDLLITEQKYIDIAKQEKHLCFNESFIAGRVEMTIEVRKKISEANKGNVYRKGHKTSEETKRKMSQAQKGISCPTRGNNLGKKLSEETKQKIRNARKKQVFTEETKQKLREHMVRIWKEGKRKPLSEEAKKKMSISAKNRWSNLEEKTKQSERIKNIRKKEKEKITY